MRRLPPRFTFDRRSIRGCLFLLLVMLLPQKKGLAADPPEHDRAQIAYQDALKLYREGRYREAIDKLIGARKLDPTAKELPYNLGLLYEKLGEIDAAIKNFELFLTLETDGEEKERVRAIIQRLEGARSEVEQRQTAASASAPPVLPPPPASSSAQEERPPLPASRKGRADALVYGTGGLALAALGAGAFFGVRALVLRPEASTANQSVSQLEEKQKEAHRSGVFADIGFGVAVVSGGVAMLLYFLRDAPAEKAVSSTFLAPVPQGGVLGWSGQF